jgi:hypothetical protein
MVAIDTRPTECLLAGGFWLLAPMLELLELLALLELLLNVPGDFQESASRDRWILLTGF